MVLDVQGASAGYDGRPVLHDVSLSVAEGECVAVMGRSGAGKSTLLGLLHDKSPAEVALIPQAAALVKTLSVFHNVYMGRLDRHSTVHNLRTLVWPRSDDVAQVSDVLGHVGLADKIHAQAGALSGGQQQRISVARALYNGRPILIGDEPVSALDGVQGGDILRVLRSRFKTLILALHDVGLALAHADRVVVLEAGRIVIDQPSSALNARDLFDHFGGRVP